MLSILKKEFNLFFASPVAYLIIGVYLMVNGLFLWILKSDFNIINAGFADLNSYFYLAPWLFLFLIPALSMKSFADEFASGTIEILKTQPLSNWQIVLGKYFACLLLILIAVLPTTSYIYTLSQLAEPLGDIDIGSITGSYLGLVFLALSYTSIGVFTSSLSNNQIVAFTSSVLISFILYTGVETLGDSVGNIGYFIKQISIYTHYKNISRGIVDTRDICYFLSLSFFFLFITKQQLDAK
ncbi:MAG: gliding motility-associated ABC transporter permease subunit GldF [Tenacibaculum sp.]